MVRDITLCWPTHYRAEWRQTVILDFRLENVYILHHRFFRLSASAFKHDQWYEPVLGWKTFTFYIIDLFVWVLLLWNMIMIWACFVFSCPVSQTAPPREKADEGRRWSPGRCSSVLTRGMGPIRGAPESPKFGWRNMWTTPFGKTLSIRRSSIWALPK